MFSFIADIILAILKFGLPVAILSWYLIDRLYQAGSIDSGSDFKTVKQSLGEAKKNWKEADRKAANFFERKWMKFGGGFYGLSALTTLIIIELKDFSSFIFNFPGFGELFSGGLGSLIGDFIAGQIQNLVMAVIWFTYWNDDNATMFVYVPVAYAGYWVGITLAGDERLQKLRKQEDAET